MKIFLRIFLSLLLCITFLFGGWHLSSAQRPAKSEDIPSQFAGSFLAISDADMIATAYATGISNKLAGFEDSLMHVSITNGQPAIESKIHATNSVISWPAILAWHPHLPFAYVAETRGKVQPGANPMGDVFSEYPRGKTISIINYGDPANPRLLQDLSVGENLQNVSINHRGDLLVAGTTERGKELLIATLSEGLIDQRFYFTDSEINEADNRDGGFRTAEFHPTQDVIAVNLNGTKVAFYTIDRPEGKVSLSRIGKSVQAGKKLSVGNWHPNGKYFLVSDVGWGNGSLGFVLNKKGYLVSVKFDDQGNHRLASKVKVGLSPEGFDISPDGQYAVAVNMRRTYLPKKFSFIPGRKRASLSLVKIDSLSGELSVIGKQYGFKGILPEDAIFDRESNSLAVAIYHDRDEGYPERGWIDFWEIQEGQLRKTNTQLYVTRGVHNLLLIP